MGKGSKRRPRSVSYEQYAANWDAAFGNKGTKWIRPDDGSAGCVPWLVSRPRKKPTINLNCQASLCNGGLEPTPVESLRPRDSTTGRNSGSPWLTPVSQG